jgi:signal transduction histidine kinase
VPGDEDSLIRALENLFRNAIDAMPQGGLLHITISHNDKLSKCVRMEIADNGVGIQPDHLDRIFDPFFSTKDVGKGTGLGLPIVHSIVQEHQGTISVESQPGVGTRFIIQLPTED